MYQLSSLSTPTASDLKALLSDSEHNQEKLLTFKNLLHFDNVKDISILRLTDELSFYFAGTNKAEDILFYLQSEAWKDDQIFNHYKVYNFRVIDYTHQNYSKNTHLFSESIGNTLTLQIDRRHHNYKDCFMFDIDRNSYNTLDFEKKILLIERLSSMINLYYSAIHVHQPLQFPKAEKESIETVLKKHNEPTTSPSIQQHFNLTTNNIHYLRHIASGCTAKEIAKHMDKSHRSVEDAVKRLCEKFRVPSKSQLQQIARIIVSQL